MGNKKRENDWVAPDWRQQLTNALVVAAVLGILGLIGTTLWDMLKDWSLVKWISVCALGGALIGFCLWSLAKNQNKAKADAESGKPSESELRPIAKSKPDSHPAPARELPRFSEKFTDVTMSVGGNRVIMPNVEGSRAVLFGMSSKGGIGLGGVGFKNPQAGAATTGMPGGGTIPAVGYIEGGKLYVDAVVYAGPGLPAMEVRRNEVANRPPTWDKNTDGKNALEIVNEAKIPVLQIIYLDEAQVEIKGVFLSGDVVAIANEGLGVVAKVNTEAIMANAPKPIFKYPAWKFPGVLNE